MEQTWQNRILTDDWIFVLKNVLLIVVFWVLGIFFGILLMIPISNLLGPGVLLSPEFLGWIANFFLIAAILKVTLNLINYVRLEPKNLP